LSHKSPIVGVVGAYPTHAYHQWLIRLKVISRFTDRQLLSLTANL